MTYEEFERTMSDKQVVDLKWDNAYRGLEIIRKYFPIETIICSVGYEQIYSVEARELVERGITNEDAILLAKLNWMIDEDAMACFV